MPLSPLALSPALPSDLLTFVLAHQVYPTTLIICQTRNTFLSSLLSSIPQPIQRQPPLLAVDNSQPKTHNESEVQEPQPPESPRHPLLIPTLHQIATSRCINLVFIPTVSHLRAYLSAFPAPKDNHHDRRPPEEKFDKPGFKVPLLIVYELVELHRDTSEWSAQGLGNSIAGLVEAGWRTQQRVIVVEARNDDEPMAGVEDDSEQANHKPIRKVWEDKVPMLNGSVRRAGFESEDSAWSGRTIEVGRVFARWFKFGRGEWDIND